MTRVKKQQRSGDSMLSNRLDVVEMQPHRVMNRKVSS